MSPYRVLAQEAESADLIVLSAMLVINKKTGNRDIYIVQKLNADTSNAVSCKQAAYTYTCRKNSNILAKYCIQIFDDISGYKVVRCAINGNLQDIRYLTEEYTQAACLASAMHDYCALNNRNIISVL